MKKISVITLVLGLSLLVTSSVNAYSEGMEGGARDARQTLIQKHGQGKLGEAIQKRWWLYFKNQVRDMTYKNRYNQQVRHQYGQESINVSDRSTGMVRAGELQDRAGIREKASESYIRANSKQTFRARAIDYYVDGGVAGKEAMRSNVIYMSKHKVARRFSRDPRYIQKLGDINAPIREANRFTGMPDKVGAGYQKISYRIGDSYRNFMHPYMGL